MLNNEDVSFIISEIRNEEYYLSKILHIQNEICMLEKEVELSALPKSTAFDNIQGGKKSTRNIASYNEEFILNVASRQQVLEKQLRYWKKWHSKSAWYKKNLLETADSDFVSDFLSGMSYSKLKRKHFISNPYSHISFIISKAITRVL